MGVYRKPPWMTIAWIALWMLAVLAVTAPVTYAGIIFLKSTMAAKLAKPAAGCTCVAADGSCIPGPTDAPCGCSNACAAVCGCPGPLWDAPTYRSGSSGRSGRSFIASQAPRPAEDPATLPFFPSAPTPSTPIRPPSPGPYPGP